MLPSIGHLLLLLALSCAVYQIGVNVVAYRMPEARRRPLLSSGFNASLALWYLVCAASGLLIYLFLTDDFSVNYVWELVQAPLYVGMDSFRLCGGTAGWLRWAMGCWCC